MAPALRKQPEAVATTGVTQWLRNEENHEVDRTTKRARTTAAKELAAQRRKAVQALGDMAKGLEETGAELAKAIATGDEHEYVAQRAAASAFQHGRLLEHRAGQLGALEFAIELRRTVADRLKRGGECG
ncbi:MAG: hypothetical protein U0263_41705 [Polyangiaceae bacterium]